MRILVSEKGWRLTPLTSSRIQESRSEIEIGREGGGEYYIGHAKLYAEIIPRDKSFLIIAHMYQSL